MENVFLPKIKIVTCSNLGCKEILGYYDVKHTKRFCRKCRVYPILLWKCEKCSNLLSNSQCRVTRKLCNVCQGMPIQS